MPTILVVDDQQCVRELVAEELAGEGYIVEAVGDAEQAEKHVKAAEPDLVVLDLFLGEPDGWEVLCRIKTDAPSVPVIIFTAYDSFKDDPRLKKADGYIIKSTDFTELKTCIAKTLCGATDPQSELEAGRFAPQMGVVQSF
jgi:CheY-like chemotaxis protein